MRAFRNGLAMGLSDALRNRLALASGESLRETVRIFLATKQERRKIAARKFPGRSIPTGGTPAHVSPSGSSVPRRDLVDTSWYSDVHALPDGTDVWDHFLSIGLPAAMAPRSSLAGPDGLHLSPRGAEFLHRLGLPLGAAADRALDPADVSALDPWTVENPSAKPLAVVTAATDPEDRLLPVAPAWTARADFFVVTDRHFPAPDPWRPVRPVHHSLEVQRRTAFARTHLPTFFSAYSRVLWVDPGVLVTADPAELLELPGAAFSSYRTGSTTLVAEAAAVALSGGDTAEAVAAFVGDVADNGALSQTALHDHRVLLIDPMAEAVRHLMAVWWRRTMRGTHAGGPTLSAALAETPGLGVGDLPGGSLDRSPCFALRGPS